MTTEKLLALLLMFSGAFNIVMLIYYIGAEDKINQHKVNANYWGEKHNSLSKLHSIAEHKLLEIKKVVTHDYP